MPMNLKEGDCYVVNHGEDLTTVDFNGYVSLAEKEDVGMVGRRDPARDRRNKMDGVETVVGQRKQGDLDGRKRRSDGYSIKSIRCSIFIALRKKMLTTSKEKLGAIATVEDSAGSDERLMKEKVVGSRECSDRGGSGFDGSRRALLGGEGAVGQRSYPITIEQRGGARCLYCLSIAVGNARLP
ncbi:hypothetical protein BHE74_00012611 [Ensete ventricosum]|nr:hypothetical protein BHE74_00012611 [Ensete ventricosum]